eukprot:sb/3463932/
MPAPTPTNARTLHILVWLVLSIMNRVLLLLVLALVVSCVIGARGGSRSSGSRSSRSSSSRSSSTTRYSRSRYSSSTILTYMLLSSSTRTSYNRASYHRYEEPEYCLYCNASMSNETCLDVTKTVCQQSSDCFHMTYLNGSDTMIQKLDKPHSFLFRVASTKSTEEVVVRMLKRNVLIMGSRIVPATSVQIRFVTVDLGWPLVVYLLFLLRWLCPISCLPRSGFKVGYDLMFYSVVRHHVTVMREWSDITRESCVSGQTSLNADKIKAVAMDVNPCNSPTPTNARTLHILVWLVLSIMNRVLLLLVLALVVSCVIGARGGSRSSGSRSSRSSSSRSSSTTRYSRSRYSSSTILTYMLLSSSTRTSYNRASYHRYEEPEYCLYCNASMSNETCLDVTKTVCQQSSDCFHMTYLNGSDTMIQKIQTHLFPFRVASTKTTVKVGVRMLKRNVHIMGSLIVLVTSAQIPFVMVDQGWPSVVYLLFLLRWLCPISCLPRSGFKVRYDLMFYSVVRHHA